MTFYKWMVVGGPVFGRGEYAQPGRWQKPIKGPLVVPTNAYHVCDKDQLPFYCGTELIEVGVRDIEIRRQDKCACRTWREVKRLAWTRKDMVEYANWCAERARQHAATAFAARTASAYARWAATAATAAAADASAYASRAAAADADAERLAQRDWILERVKRNEASRKEVKP